MNVEATYISVIEKRLFDKSNCPIKVSGLSEINKNTLSESKADKGYKFKYIDIGSVIYPKKLGALETYIFSDAPSRARRRVKSGDILISTVRPNLRAFVRLTDLDTEHIASTGFAVITPQDKLIGDLLFHSFFSNHFIKYCEKHVTGTNYPAISAKDIGDFIMYLPKDKSEQLEIQKMLNSLEKILDLLSNCRMRIVGLQHLFSEMLLTNNYGESHV